MSVSIAQPGTMADTAGAAPVETARGALNAAVEALFETLGRDGVAHAVLRGNEARGELGDGGDIDLVVPARDLPRFEARLQAGLQGSGVEIYERFRAGDLSQYYLHARSGAGEHAFGALDVHTAESCRGVPFLEAEALLPRSPSGPLAEQPARAVVNFLGPFLSGGAVPTRHARALCTVATVDGWATGRLLARLFGRRRGRALLAAVRRGDVTELTPDVAGYRRALQLRCFARRPLRSLSGVLRFAWGARVRPLLRPRGRLVVFLGTDGSGKSTLAEALIARLAPVFRDGAVSVCHQRPKLLPRLHTLLHLGRSRCAPAPAPGPHRARPSGSLGSWLRVAYYWLDYTLGYALRVLPRRRRHALVVFDRWFHDLLVDPRRYRVKPGCLLARWLAPLTPRPDATIVCTAAVETVQARKQELGREESARQLSAYARLARERSGFFLVSSEQDLEAAVGDVLAVLFPGGRV